jgi:hypothetical protein
MRTAPFTALAALILTVAVSAPVLAATAAPKITSFTASRHTVSGNKATKVTVNASLRHGASCTLRSEPAIAGLPKTAACTTSFDKTVTVPANTSGTGGTFTLTLKATKGDKSASRAVTVKQSGATPPNVVISAKPTSLTAAGGKVTIRGTVTHTKTCALTSKPNLGSKKGSCSSGTIIKAFTVPPNMSGSSRFFAFMVKAVGPGGSTTGTLLLRQPAGPVAVTLITSSPASLPAGGGPLRVHGTVTGAKTCSMTSTPDVGSGSVPCKDGTFSKDFTIPANSTASPGSYSFNLSASGAGGSADATLTLDQPVAAADPPNVVSMTPSPASLTAAAGTVTVSATLARASHCTWTSDPDVGSATSAPCTTSSSHDFSVPANVGKTAKTYTFEIDVTGPGGTASSSLTMTQPATVPVGPQITSITPNPTSLTSGGGTLTVTAGVQNASTCSITSSPDVGSTGSNVPCTSNSVSHPFTIPANTGTTSKSYTFTVSAKANNTTVTGTLTMTQPAAVPPGPKVTSMTSSPKTVDYHGGTFTITAHLTHGATCTMKSDPDVGSKGSTDCSSGTFTGTVTFPKNKTASSVPYTVTVHVTGPGGTASGTLTYYVPPKPATARGGCNASSAPCARS